MLSPFILIGLVIGANSVLGYQLGLDRAQRRGSRDALSAFHRGAFEEAFRHWVMVTLVASVVGAGVGRSWGPGPVHGLAMVSGASVLIALPMTYLAGWFYTRRALRTLADGPDRVSTR